MKFLRSTINEKALTVELSPAALPAEALTALLAVQEFSGNTEPTATLPLPRNSFRFLHAPSFPLTQAVCSTLFPWELHSWAHSTGFAEEKVHLFSKEPMFYTTN